MTHFTGTVPQKPAPSRRRYKRAIILALCAAFALTIFVCCYAVTVVVAAIPNLLGGLFNGLGKAIAAFISMVTVGFVCVVFPSVMELLGLLSSGQLIPFVMRLCQLLGPS